MHSFKENWIKTFSCEANNILYEKSKVHAYSCGKTNSHCKLIIHLDNINIFSTFFFNFKLKTLC
jgi:hypothetical protein